jgi:glutamate N-acetyltransferase / amino-acid N-acetyltransferase
MSEYHIARGYRFAGVHCGIRDHTDLALIVSDSPASAAGVFTQNRVCAAPVHVCRERLPADAVRGIVVCAGNANACTGPRGLADARRMTTVAAEAVGCRPEQVLVASTGVIGRHLPMDRVEPGIRHAFAELQTGSLALDRAAHAILTTDTRIKVSTRRVEIDGLAVNVTGFAKGAAMIGPNMATMLAFVLSDAGVSPADLATLAARAAEQSFNCVRVEGHTSTNDSLILLANGVGQRLDGPRLARFAAAVTDVCTDLAKAIVADAEGASHFVTLDVEGLRDDDEARRIARAVADSPLVKTAIFGADPNWGRIVSAAGYAGPRFNPRGISLKINGTLLYEKGGPVAFDAKGVSHSIRQNRETHVEVLFSEGNGHVRFWTTDLTAEYVRLNADYTT